MKKSNLPEERRKRLAIEEAMRRDALAKAAREHLNRQGMGRPPLLPFALAASVLTAVITTAFFPPNHLPVLVNTLLAALLVSTGFGLLTRYVVSPLLDSLTLNWVLAHQISQAQIARRINTVYGIVELLMVAALILTGAWVGQQTTAREGLFIWNWIGNVLR